MRNEKTMILLAILAALAIIAGGLLIYKIITREHVDQVSSTEDYTEENNDTLVVTPKQVKIFSGNDRPIAVMIDNHSGAWPQANLNKAYIV